MDPEGRWWLLEQMQQTSERVTPRVDVFLRPRGRQGQVRFCDPRVDSSQGRRRPRGLSLSHRERERSVPRPSPAAHDDCDGHDRDRDMKKRYGDSQNMIAVFVAFAVP